ncbi:hypothetical protein AMTRI_Chr04g242740 [Amborella trichopoda]
MAYCSFTFITSSIVSPLPLLMLLFFTTCLNSSAYSLPLCHEDERLALLEFKASLIHPNDTSKGVEYFESWKGLNCCLWNRVECHITTSHVVTDLGIVPLNATSLARLHQLSHLGLGYNNLGGQLPLKGLLSSLELLTLGGNMLHGSIPSALGTLQHLKQLNLNNNQLNGSIPPSLCTLPFLEKLELNDSESEGAIPSCLGNFTHIHQLSLNGNELVGSIPPTLVNRSALQCLSLIFNHLGGSIPQELGRLHSLESLYLIDNDLLVSLSDNTNLTILPSNDTHSFQLKILEMHSCNMSKFDISIPSFLSTQKRLDDVDFSNSNIQGPTPPWLLQSMKGLRLSGNFFSGPLILLNMPSILEHLNISDNKLSGELLHLFSNIANYINDLKLLDMLDLSTNKIIRNLPSSTYHFENLNLSNNKITGRLPCNLTRGYQLKYLGLSNNYLEGPLVSEYFNISSLESLHLDGTILNGTIPENLLLRSLSLVALNIANNNMSGAIPTELNKLTYLELLNLRGSHFMSGIPFSLCQLQQLAVLDLAQNNLHGPIPPCFHNICALSGGFRTHRGQSIIITFDNRFNLSIEEEANFAKG